MNDRPRVDHRQTWPVVHLLQRFATFGLVLVAGGLLVLGKADPGVTERLRASVSDSVAPLLDVMSAPSDTLTGAVGEVRSWIQLHEENARLKAEREHLRHWQAVALRLEAENAALRRLLSLVPEPGLRAQSARVIADPGGSFAHSVLLNGGERDGIGLGDVALVGEGLIGRIVGLADRSSRVLLITDLNSRVPVVVTPGRVRGVLAGTNSDQPRLIHVGAEAPISVGDPVLTSGDGGAYPPGLPVGVVAASEADAIVVKPYMDRSRLEFVRVVDYGLQGIIGSRHRGGRSNDREPERSRDAGSGRPPADPPGSAPPAAPVVVGQNAGSTP